MLLLESQIAAPQMEAIASLLLSGKYSQVGKPEIREVLRHLKLQHYIEKWLQIIYRCTGVAPPNPGPLLIDKLDTLFLELQRPFAAYKTPKRRNFLNYNYVFCRLFQLLELDQEYGRFFPLIKSKSKLKQLDDTWALMCESINWKCLPPLTPPPAFSVKLHGAAEKLARLRGELANQSLVEPKIKQPQIPTPLKNRTRLLPPPRRPKRPRPPRELIGPAFQKLGLKLTRLG